MTIRRVQCVFVAIVLFGLLPVTTAYARQVQLAPVVSGLTAPVFVGHAGDGTSRLFILERAGKVLVLPQGASTGLLFLDITSKVKSTGSEQGLLGLAFHPQYTSNRRFFVFYTRETDGAIQISEFRATADPNIADDMEFPLLTIPHAAATNHNGGMIAFGNDGYLYIAVGDGGGANDVPNNAQNLNVLLGKILRLDLSTPGAYAIPSDNPFVNKPGLDEIFAYGLRNPWRFSVDRSNGQLWVGDVGQGQREEVDAPIVKEGNYGWRVFEGTNCTGNGPAACEPANYISPVIEYAHAGGRCSITGGYVYRGSLGTFTSGTYLYADFCTGEIFTSVGGVQSLLLDTTGISSFGEDQAGEIYVVHYGGGSPGNGSISRLTQPPAPCTYSINPISRSIAASGGTGSVAVTSGAQCDWTAAANADWLHVTSGATGTSNGNVSYSVDVNASPSPRSGTMTIAGRTFTVDQSASAQCTFSITPTRASFGAGAATGSVSVTAGPGCDWTATSNASWITVTGGTPGNGSGVVTYSLAPYTGKPKRRNGTVTIAGQTFTVTQSR